MMRRLFDVCYQKMVAVLWLLLPLCVLGEETPSSTTQMFIERCSSVEDMNLLYKTAVSWPQSVLDAANALLNQKNFSGAHNCFKLFKSVSPNEFEKDHIILNNAAIAALFTFPVNILDVIAFLNLAIQIEPTYLPALKNLEWVYIVKGESGNAAVMRNRIIQEYQKRVSNRSGFIRSSIGECEHVSHTVYNTHTTNQQVCSNPLLAANSLLGGEATFNQDHNDTSMMFLDSVIRRLMQYARVHQPHVNGFLKLFTDWGWDVSRDVDSLCYDGWCDDPWDLTLEVDNSEEQVLKDQLTLPASPSVGESFHLAYVIRNIAQNQIVGDLVHVSDYNINTPILHRAATLAHGLTRNVWVVRHADFTQDTKDKVKSLKLMRKLFRDFGLLDSMVRFIPDGFPFNNHGKFEAPQVQSIALLEIVSDDHKIISTTLEVNCNSLFHVFRNLFAFKKV